MSVEKIATAHKLRNARRRLLRPAPWCDHIQALLSTNSGTFYNFAPEPQPHVNLLKPAEIRSPHVRLTRGDIDRIKKTITPTFNAVAKVVPERVSFVGSPLRRYVGLVLTSEQLVDEHYALVEKLQPFGLEPAPGTYQPYMILGQLSVAKEYEPSFQSLIEPQIARTIRLTNGHIATWPHK